MTEEGNSFMNCTKDDTSNCCGKCPFNVVAVIPCFGRLPLLRHTVSRLINKNRVKVVLVGNEAGVQKIAKDFNCTFVNHTNTKLGQKWNAGFQFARTLNPDAVLFVGSSDWVSDNWVAKMLPLLNEHEMIGTLGCYLVDINSNNPNRLVYWPGYGEGERENEPIGIGRLISKRALDKMDWQPFDPQKNNSMDWQMWRKLIDNGGTVKIINQDDIKSVSISTNLWPNKHKFIDHWNGNLPSEKLPESMINEWFPEIVLI